ncbi:hypothetical protein PN466_03420 [Roseofilum reptotaenium CS-1145]|uniref:Uncharacterized protein n=1 Tax=Roseofilum reptotaenium AO1-A TaxID=1925591 RepID=A0A1L9QLR2_9CYAN|nr:MULTISPECIES: hypothetical protein [Roseofilum]MBP0030517.1 hypothetical protein [Roseofilum sp. Guam]MDB9516009.1 hypothetical protein [Roseofilum reptotaenium CS-1145]OJJ20645.1 hypothetical protein BI308_20790 [Roseofilum reptotaenium AO1-A]
MKTSLASPSTVNLEQIIERIFETRQISRADQEGFMRLLLSKDALSFADQRQIDRVFEGLRQGRLRVVD